MRDRVILAILNVISILLITWINQRQLNDIKTELGYYKRVNAEIIAQLETDNRLTQTDIDLLNNIIIRGDIK